MLTRHTRGYLPHIEVPQATYFLTFHLEDSLPVRLLSLWTNELKIQKSRQKNNPASIHELEREYYRKIEAHLDSNSGCCWLKNPAIATLVRNALLFFDHQRYELHAWTIMPNHVHVLFTP